MHNFKELKVWQDSMKYCQSIYEITKRFPESERFGLANQMRRASVSIPSNIAEGTGRGSDKDFSKFISYSLGSSYELETQLLIAFDLEFILQNDLNVLLDDLMRIQKMLNKFNEHLKSKS